MNTVCFWKVGRRVTFSYMQGTRTIFMQHLRTFAAGRCIHMWASSKDLAAKSALLGLLSWSLKFNGDLSVAQNIWMHYKFKRQDILLHGIAWTCVTKDMSRFKRIVFIYLRASWM